MHVVKRPITEEMQKEKKRLWWVFSAESPTAPMRCWLLINTIFKLRLWFCLCSLAATQKRAKSSTAGLCWRGALSALFNAGWSQLNRKQCTLPRCCQLTENQRARSDRKNKKKVTHRSAESSKTQKSRSSTLLAKKKPKTKQTKPKWNAIHCCYNGVLNAARDSQATSYSITTTFLCCIRFSTTFTKQRWLQSVKSHFRFPSRSRTCFTTHNFSYT